MRIPRVMIAGPASGVGKTTVATGLMAALTAARRTVAGFKVGPDFIDPSYHQAATGRPGRNLDAFLSGPELIAGLFAHGARDADIAVVEGVMGLFDGASGRGELASTAQIALLLEAPIVLVVDAAAMGRSIAALVHGYATYDPRLRIAGVVANRVGSERHAEILREALAPMGLPLLGVLHRDALIAAPSRHLGLVPVAEQAGEAARIVAALADRIGEACDIEAIARIAESAPALAPEPWEPAAASASRSRIALGSGSPVRVAVASGPAFSFLYAENLELLAAAGAELVAFDPTVDERLPDGAGALYLGGGFPEAHAPALSANTSLRGQIADFARAGRPVLAECGGLLYLCESLDGLPMCGVINAQAHMTEQLTLGYREAVAAADSLWARGAVVRGHEFHYSTVVPNSGQQAAWKLADGEREGFVVVGVHASYLHTHWAASPQVAGRFVAAAARQAVTA